MNNFGALYFIYVIFRGGQLRKWIIRVVGSAYRNKKQKSPKPKTARRKKDSPQRCSAPNWRHTRRVVSTKPGKKAKTHWRKCCAVLSPLIVLNDVRQIKLVPQYCHHWNLAEWATWSVIIISAFRRRFAAIKANGRREIRHRTPRNS